MSTLDKRILRLLQKFKTDFISVNYYNGESENYISESAFHVTGFTPKELLKQMGGIYGIIYEEDRFPVKRFLTELFSGDENSAEFSFRIVTKNNQIKWIKQTLFIERDSFGKIAVIDAINHDSSAELNKENDEQNDFQKVVELNAAKDKFISIVSHDLRAPFTSILGFSEILINEPTISEDEKFEYLGYINNAAQTQLQLVNHLLDWSRLQTGRLTIEPHRLNAKSLLANAASLLTGMAIRKNISVYISADDNLFVNADERLITQVINNLLSNAIKFTEQGKSITITADIFKAGFIEIVIKDEGKGIAEKDQTKIFKLGEKLSLTGTEGEKGSGLGLILVKDIIEKHGGDIWFYSKEGVGTEFHFTLPEAKNLVLLVEDDVDLLNLYKKYISKSLESYEVIEANNGYEAMRVILNRLPSLVITDHEMPLMSGIQLIEALRKKEGNRNVPVIVISAKFDENLKQKYQQLGVNKMIPKPVVGKQFIDIILETVC